MWNKLSHDKWTIIYRSKVSDKAIYNHEHADLLHFMIEYDDIQILIDSGRSSYKFDDVHFDAFKSQYHNSVTIDKLSYQPEYSKYFPNDYYHSNFDVAVKQDNDILKITFNGTGFNRIDRMIQFKREVMLTNKYLLITDISMSPYTHIIDNYFHISKDFFYDLDNDVLTNNVSNLTIRYSGKCKFLSQDNKLTNGSEKYGEIYKKSVLHSTEKIDSNRKIINKFEIV